MNLVEVLFSTFDFIVIVSLLFLNVLMLKIKLKQNVGCLVVGLIFGIILPLVSIKLEIDRATEKTEILDNFELLYTYLRFPLYWFTGIGQLFLLKKQ